MRTAQRLTRWGGLRLSPSPRLRRVAAEVEGVAALRGEVDFGDEARLADGVGPGFPAVVAALGGFGENPRHSGDRFQNCLRVFRGDAQEHAGGAGGLAASLLPISQCRRADAERG